MSPERAGVVTDFGQTDFDHPYVIDFGQSDFGEAGSGQKNVSNLTDLGQNLGGRF